MTSQSFAHMFAAANGGAPAAPQPQPAPAQATPAQPAPMQVQTAPAPMQQAQPPQPQQAPAMPASPAPAQAQPAAPGVTADGLLGMLTQPPAQPQGQPMYVVQQQPPAQPQSLALNDLFFGDPTPAQPAPAQPAPAQPAPAQPAPAAATPAQPAPAAAPAQQTLAELRLAESLNFSDLSTMEGLTPEQRREYESALPMMDTIVRHRIREAMQGIENPMAQRLGQLQQTVDGIPQQVQSTRRENYQSALGVSIPNFQQTLADPNFQNYLRQPAPMRPGQTIYDMLRDANSNMNVAGVQAIFSSYQAEAQNNPAVAQNTAQLYDTPQAQPVSPAVGTSSPKPKLSIRERDVLYRRMQQGDQQVASAWSQIEAAYSEAERDGRLVE